METSPLRCIDCGQRLQIVFGSWLPFCMSCIPSPKALWEIDSEVTFGCLMCGRTCPERIPGQPIDMLCPACSSARPHGLQGDTLVYCLLCRRPSALESLGSEWKVSESSENPLEGVLGLFFCHRCLRIVSEVLLSLTALYTHGETLGPLHPDEDLCLVGRLKAADKSIGRHPTRGWTRWFHSADINFIDRIIESENVCCSDALLTDEPEPLPGHVCINTLRESCARAFPLAAIRRPRSMSRIVDERGVSPTEAFHAEWRLSVAEDELGHWVESLNTHLNLPRSDPKPKRSPAWEIFGAPARPIRYEDDIVGMVVTRACEAGRVTLYGTIAVEGLADERYFGQARVDTRSRGADRAARKWLRTQEDTLRNWYDSVMLGQKLPGGRPKGPVWEKGEIEKMYESAITSLLRQKKKVTYASIAASMKTVIGESTVRKYVTEDKVLDPYSVVVARLQSGRQP